jgi:hypothetical protein
MALTAGKHMIPVFRYKFQMETKILRQECLVEKMVKYWNTIQRGKNMCERVLDMKKS